MIYLITKKKGKCQQCKEFRHDLKYEVDVSYYCSDCGKFYLKTPNGWELDR